MSGFGRECAEIVRAAREGSYKIGMILGSGLGALAEEVEDAVRIPYSHLTEFPVSTVTSHSSELVAGTLSGVPVVILSGRAHYYEGGDPTVMRTPVETLKELGCEILLATNAAGSLRQEVAPGSPMLISDHINWSGMNPLIGEEDEKRFLDMSTAYDADLRAAMKKVAEETGDPVAEGVYMWFSGPSFETLPKSAWPRHWVRMRLACQPCRKSSWPGSWVCASRPCRLSPITAQACRRTRCLTTKPSPSPCRVWNA